MCTDVNEQLDQHIWTSQRISTYQMTSELYISNRKQCKNGLQSNQGHFSLIEL